MVMASLVSNPSSQAKLESELVRKLPFRGEASPRLLEIGLEAMHSKVGTSRMEIGGQVCQS